MRLLIFNLATDADDPVLGFTSRWIDALARRVDHVDVITMRAGRMALPANVKVRSVGKERGFSEPRRVLEFYRHLHAVLRPRSGIDAVFSHMMPVFSALGGPILRVRGIPLITWYAHASRTIPLRVAHALSDRMVTSVPTAYPFDQAKLTPLGQGIDTTLFHPDGTPSPVMPEVLYVSRISRVKDQAMLIKAARLMRDRGLKFRVVLLGPVLTTDDAVYRQELGALIDALDLGAHVEILDAQPLNAMPPIYRHASVAVNLTPLGSFDKTGLESMCCGTVTVVANLAYADTLGSDAELLLLPARDETILADRLEHILRLSDAERRAIGERLQARSSKRHSLDALIERLLQLIRSLVRK